MGQYFSLLQNCLLLRNLSRREVEVILTSTNQRIREYPSGSVIALEGEDCHVLGIVLEGEIEIQKLSPSGKTVTVAQFSQGNIFGEAIVFSKEHLYPGTIVTKTPAKILFLPRETVISLCRNYPPVLESFMELLSERILMLNKKIKELSLGTIRQKICHFLLEQYQSQKTFSIKLNLSKQALAEHMGIQRPSLSRELTNMRDEGLIDWKKDQIEIKSLEKLEDLLM